MEFQVTYLALFCLFAVLDSFGWFLVIIAIYVDDTTSYSRCDQPSDLWQQLELASEIESNLQDTVD